MKTVLNSAKIKLFYNFLGEKMLRSKIGLKLKIKKTKLMTTGKTTRLQIVNEDVKVMDSFCLLRPESVTGMMSVLVEDLND